MLKCLEKFTMVIILSSFKHSKLIVLNSKYCKKFCWNFITWNLIEVYIHQINLVYYSFFKNALYFIVSFHFNYDISLIRSIIEKYINMNTVLYLDLNSQNTFVFTLILLLRTHQFDYEFNQFWLTKLIIHNWKMKIWLF